ncbi:MAG: 2-oxoacid:acceptor oxidoreductase subunit alpha [Deltaproteobacteria bacterium]|nr:2-oxoacid:acceptor oxidoreductase subunit alpha [Deltaproteobacteria bacterium]
MAEKRKKVFMQGNEACAEGALYAGCTFFGGYPITPSTEVAEVLSRRLPPIGGKWIQMEDEIGGISATIGGAIAGHKALTATSGPGLSLKQEGLGYACMAEIPCVVVNVMRGGPSTGYPTGPGQSDIMQAKWGTHGDHPVITLTPASVPEILTETVRAFNLAEKYRTPVFVFYDEIVGHMREAVTIPLPGDLEVVNRAKPTCKPEDYLPYDTKFEVPPLAPFGTGYRFHITGLNHKDDGFPTNDGATIQEGIKRLIRKIDNNLKDIEKNEEYMTDDAEIVIFAFGSTARSAKFAAAKAREKGRKVGVLRPITMWPFPEAAVRKLAKNARAFIVPELNLGMMRYEVERCAEGADIVPINRVDGEPIKPQQIIDEIEKLSK